MYSRNFMNSNMKCSKYVCTPSLRTLFATNNNGSFFIWRKLSKLFQSDFECYCCLYQVLQASNNALLQLMSLCSTIWSARLIETNKSKRPWTYVRLSSLSTGAGCYLGTIMHTSKERKGGAFNCLRQTKL